MLTSVRFYRQMFRPTRL